MGGKDLRKKRWNRAAKKEQELLVFDKFKDGDAKIRLFVGTFNVNAKSPKKCPSLHDWLDLDNDADVYAIGMQEVVGLNALNMIRPEHMSRPWEAKVSSELGPNYVLVCAKQLLGVLLMVFIKKSFFPFLSNLQFDTVGCGILGRGSNKGAVAIRMCIFDTSFCFITSHLAAKQKKVKARTKNFHDICARIRLHNYKEKFKFHEQSKNKMKKRKHEGEQQLRFMFWCGDLNYRLDVEDLDWVHKIIDEGRALELLKFDQLISERKAGRVFQGFHEGKITFQPTYKFQPGTNKLERRPNKKQRYPAWCDRILWLRPSGKDDIKQLFYRSSDEPRASDHKPVGSAFEVRVHVESKRPLYLPWWFGVFVWDTVELFLFIIMCGQVAVHLPTSYRNLIHSLTYVYFPTSGFKNTLVTSVADWMRSGLGDITPEMNAYMYQDSNTTESSCDGMARCPKLGMPYFAVSSHIDPFSVFSWHFIFLLLILFMWSLVFAGQQVARLVGGLMRRRFRWHATKKYTWWRFQGGIIRMLTVFYYPFMAAAWYQISVAAAVGNPWPSTLLAVLCMLFFPNLVFAFRLKQLRDLKESYNNWAIYKNREIKLKFGCLFYEYREEYFGFIVVKLAYFMLDAVIVGTLYSYALPQVVLLLVVQVAYLVVLAVCRPYEGSVHNTTAMLFQLLRLVHVLMLVFFLPEVNIDASGRDLFALFAVTMHAITFVVVIMIALTNVFRQYRNAHCPCVKDKSHKELAAKLNNRSGGNRMSDTVSSLPGDLGVDFASPANNLIAAMMANVPDEEMTEMNEGRGSVRDSYPTALRGSAMLDPSMKSSGGVLSSASPPDIRDEAPWLNKPPVPESDEKSDGDGDGDTSDLVTNPAISVYESNRNIDVDSDTSADTDSATSDSD